MVTINLTIVVVTGLFLVFLWMMHLFVFRPILEVMDERERRLAEDQAEALRLEAESRSLEREFKEQLALLHKDANARILSVHRQAQEEHLARVEELKRREAEELRQVRAEAQAVLQAERAHYPALVGDLRHRMARKLGLEREGA